MYKLIIGLGNPEAYKLSRHNVGKQFLNFISSSWQEEFGGKISRGPGIILYKPRTYMNICGGTVKGVITGLGLELKDILIVHDDIELDFGKVKIRKLGSAQGHNGLRSIIKTLGTTEFHRLQIGIGKPSNLEVSDHVLSPFTPEESNTLHEEIFSKCIRDLGISKF